MSSRKSNANNRASSSSRTLHNSLMKNSNLGLRSFYGDGTCKLGGVCEGPSRYSFEDVIY